MIELDFENGSDRPTPDQQLFQQWVNAALDGIQADAELSMRIVDEDEMTKLNSQFRDQDKSTNVLSFPAEIPAGLSEQLGINPLGDIAICSTVIEREAHEQGKSLEAHYAHMSVHGALHLIGYDHIDQDEADAMEAKEVQILKQLGYSNPYQSL